MAHTTERAPARSSDAIVQGLRALAVLAVLALVWQFVTAGSLVGSTGSASVEELHGTGAIVLHVVTGLTMIAAAAVWRLRGAPAWPMVVAAVVFGLSFVQAYYGDGQTLWIHVPGALVLSVGSVVVATWAFSRTARA